MKDSEEIENAFSKEKQIKYGVSVADHIFKRIEKHVRLLKCLEDRRRGLILLWRRLEKDSIQRNKTYTMATRN